jgi:hypothetical protein
MILTNLRALHRNMINSGVTADVFPFDFNGKGFSCMFVTNVVPFRLYICSLGSNAFAIEVTVNNGYIINPKLEYEDYKLLVNYLELRSDSFTPFKTSFFFSHFNLHIPAKATQVPKSSEIIRTVSRHRNVEEADKIYFCGLRNNPNGQKVSNANYEKTMLAFGKKTADAFRKENKSTRWSDNPNDEDLILFNRK